MRRVCLVSSGTGGHLLPAIVLASALRAEGHAALLVVEGRAVESELLARAGAEAASLRLGGGLALPWRLARATFAARAFLKAQEVDLVLATGGRTSIPVGLAARLLGIPLCLLEQNAVAGRSNRLLAPLARRAYLGLPSRRPLPRGLLTGTPLRAEIGQVGRAEARAALGLRDDRPVILVTGGSQGARALNELVPDALCRVRRPLQILHLSGSGADTAVRSRYAAGEANGLWCSVKPLTTEMAAHYAAADLVICRGGGGTVAELMRAARAAIVVPYPFHRDHQQLHNARVLAAAGAARVLEQHALTVAGLTGEVEDLLHGDTLTTMGQRAAALCPADPCRRILSDLREVWERS